MKIELRSIKHAKFASQETDCFQAKVLIDGKDAGTVSNEGHGGCNMYHPHALAEKLREYAKTLPNLKTAYGDLEMDPDLIIGKLFDKWSAEKDLQKLLKSRIVFLREGKVFQSRKMLPEYMEKVFKPENADILKTFNAEIVLNTLPLDEAVDLFIANTKGA